MTNTIKGLPLQDLTVAAVVHVTVEDNMVDDFPVRNVEMEVVNEASWSRIENQMPKVQTCACCGHRLTYACAIEHTPTGIGYWIGRECAAKIASLQATVNHVAYLSVALAERAACNKRQSEVVAKYPVMAEPIAYAKNTFAPAVLIDMVDKIRRYGNVSDAQVAFALKLVAEDKAKRASATKTIVPGRQIITGTVLSLKDASSPFGTVTKMLVDIGGGVKIYGNKPSALGVIKGSIVTMTATVEASERDPLFGFFSRPSKASVVSTATVAA